MKIIKNKIKCNYCDDIIESKYSWDYNVCKCGAVGIDGGIDYLRRIGRDEDYVDLSVVDFKCYKCRTITTFTNGDKGFKCSCGARHKFL